MFSLLKLKIMVVLDSGSNAIILTMMVLPIKKALFMKRLAAVTIIHGEISLCTLRHDAFNEDDNYPNML